MSEALRLPEPSVAPPGLVFRAWSEDDVPDLVAAWRDPEMRRWMPEEEADPFDADVAASFVKEAARLRAEARALPIAIEDSATGRVIGSVTFNVWDRYHWNVGYWVVTERRGQGLASKTVSRLARWAFEAHPGLERLSLYTLPGNEASQRVAAHAGFRLEGVLRRWARISGESRDWVMHSLIRSDLA